MRGKSLYGRRKATGQTETIVHNFGGGVNEYLPPISIGDNQLSDGVDYISRDGLCLKHWMEEDTESKYTFTGTGVMVTWNGTTSGIFPLMASTSTPFHATVIDGTAADYSVSSYSFIALPDTTGALEYITQAETYSIYWSTSMNILLVQAQSTRALSSVTLPTGVYPRDVVSHRTRLFVLDTHNTLWYSKGGDYTKWFGAVDADDASYTFIDSNDSKNRICSFRDNLYVYGDQSIHVFSGYSEPTWSMNTMFVDIGTYGYSYRSLTKDANYMYFTYKSKVYAYDGSSNFPMLISEPVVSDNKYVNGIFCGVKPWNETYYTIDSVLSLYADENYLYWYPFYNVYVGAGTVTNNYINQRIGMFDTKRRTWWKVSGFSRTYNFIYQATGSHLYMFPAPEAQSTYWGVGIHTNENVNQVPKNEVRKLPPWVSTSLFSTKAFSVRPSENMLLTDIYLLIRTTDSPNTVGYSAADFDVYLLDAHMDSEHDDTLSTSHYKTRQVYGLQSFNDGSNDADYKNMFVPIHIPLSSYMAILYQNTGDGAEEWTDGIFDNYQHGDISIGAPAFLPTPYVKLLIKMSGDPYIELHRMELKYRVKGASR